MLGAIGLDIGSTRTKVVDCGEEIRPGKARGFYYDPKSDPRPFTPEAADAMARYALDNDCTRVGVTGTGASTFVEAAKKYPDLVVIVPDGDAIDRETKMLVAGIRSLARMAGEPLPDEFGLFGIGTGVAPYLHVTKSGFRRFPFGSHIGGGTIVGTSRMTAEMIADFGRTHVHGDLELQHRLPELAGSSVGEFVLAGYGNMGHELGHDSILKDASTAAKAVVTGLARDIMFMNMIPDWKPAVPLVFIGTPVDKFDLLRGWLDHLCEKFGMPHRYVQDSAFAGALGAYELACAAK